MQVREDDPIEQEWRLLSRTIQMEKATHKGRVLKALQKHSLPLTLDQVYQAMKETELKQEIKIILDQLVAEGIVQQYSNTNWTAYQIRLTAQIKLLNN